MELRHLRYFVAVAEELHFGHAAERLNTSQPSLSQQIRALERELKVDLFKRTRRHVELTPAGRRFFQEARSILTAADRATGLAREAARDEAWSLVVGVSADTDWTVLGPALRLFAEHVPSPRALFQNLAPEAQIAALRTGRIDVGFVTLPLDAEGLVTEKTGRTRLMVALRRDHPMARKRAVRLEDLAKEAYTLWPRHLAPGSYDHLFAVFSRAGFGPPITMEGDLPSTRTLLGMVAAGLTIALVDPSIAGTDAPGVVCRPLHGPPLYTENGVIYRRDDASPVLEHFLHGVRALSEAGSAARNGERKVNQGRRRAG